MDWIWFALLCGTALITLLLMRVPVATTLIAVALLGLGIASDYTSSIEQVTSSIVTRMSGYSLLPIPMFILLGELLFKSGFATRALDGLALLTRFLPGRLAMLNIAAGTLLGTASGSSTATTAILSKAMVPQMEQRGYSKRLSIGSTVASGGLSMIIPPSALAVILAAEGGFPVGKLLMAGLLPGLLMAFNYVLIIGVWSIRFRGAPRKEISDDGNLRQLFGGLIPVLGIGAIVVGSILFGIATPTESAALGVLAVFVLTLLYRRYSWTMLWESLRDTAVISSMILFLVVGAMLFSQAMAAGGVTAGLTMVIKELAIGPYVALFLMLAIVMFLGLWLESVSIVLVTIPLFLPIMQMYGMDPIWFGILMLIAVSIGLLTPPFGLNLFVAKGIMPDVPMRDVYLSALPFVLADFITLIMLIVMPGIVLAVPSLMD